MPSVDNRRVARWQLIEAAAKALIVERTPTTLGSKHLYLRDTDQTRELLDQLAEMLNLPQ